MQPMQPVPQSPPKQKQSSALLNKIYGVIEKATGYSFPNLKDQPGSPGRRGGGGGALATVARSSSKNQHCESGSCEL